MSRILPLLTVALTPLFLFAEAPASNPAPVPAAPAPTVAAPTRFITGAQAPAFLPEKWLKGEPVTAFEKDKVYLVECWATWCGPCVAAIPHVNELHRKFQDKGLVVIGANVMGDPEKKAADFVAKKGDGMAYRVAYDGKSGRVERDWLEAAGVRGIPHAFVIREGKLIWHGHPMRLNESMIETMLAGKFDGVAEMAKQDAEDAAEAAKVSAYRSARLEVLKLIREKKHEEALAKVESASGVLSAMVPADPEFLRGLVLSERGDAPAALEHFRRAAELSGNDGASRFRLADALLNRGAARDNKLALECARMAATKGAPAFVFTLLAQAEYASGNKDAALRILDDRLAQLTEHERALAPAMKAAREAVAAGQPWPASPSR